MGRKAQNRHVLEAYENLVECLTVAQTSTESARQAWTHVIDLLTFIECGDETGAEWTAEDLAQVRTNATRAIAELTIQHTRMTETLEALTC